MSEDALVQTQIDSDIRDRAEKVLQDAGMTIPDLLRLALTRTAEYGEVPYGLSSADDPEYTTPGSAPRSRKPSMIRDRI